MNIRTIFCAAVLSAILFASCNRITVQTDRSFNVIPHPMHVEMQKGAFVLSPATTVRVHFEDSSMPYATAFLNDLSEDLFKEEFEVVTGGITGSGINICKDTTICPEGYRMEVTRSRINIHASTSHGVYYAFQTLRQMIPTEAFGSYGVGAVEIPCAVIKDAPEMKYRGALLDVGRHFFSVEEVKTFIDMMAMHKLNCFHWHLTEDQGWRIEIKKYPLLTEIGSVRENSQVIGTHHVHNVGYSGTPYGPYFYTQDQIRDVVKYAEENFVTVVPEIDLPGHSRAALAAYPHLGCKGKDYTVGVKWGVQDEVMCVGRESTFEFIEDVMEEVLKLFPSEYIHIGGDECRRKHWEECPACQARMRAEGFKREAELQTYCNHRVEALLKKHGRKMIGWDEVLDGGVSESTIVMSWTGVDGGIQAAKAGNDVIMTPHQYCYLNVPNSPDRDHEPPHGTRHPARRTSVTLDKAYGYNPYEGLDEDQRKHIIGIQASLWTEHIRLFDHAMYMMNPRMGAISEIGWCNSGKDFQRYIKSQKRLLDLYEHYGYNYAESYWRDN